MEELFLLICKVLLCSAMVIGITLIAERGNPRFAGVLLGFPLGAGLALFFLGIEQGKVFAAQAALWSVPGVLAMLSFCVGYERISRLAGSGRLFSVVFCTACGLVCYFLMSFCIHTWLGGSGLMCLLSLLAGIPVFGFLLRGNRKRCLQVTPARNNVYTILGRALFASLVIITVTGTAELAGSSWSGIFAAFPTAILPSTVILHYRYGGKIVGTLFTETTYGMFGIIVFALAVALFFPLLGVYGGVAVAYILSFIYLFIYEKSIRPLVRKILAV